MLACVLVVAMVFSSLPMSALAATVQEQEITSSSSAETSSQSSEEEVSSEENQNSVQSEDETSSQKDPQTSSDSDEEASPGFDDFTIVQPDVSIGVETGENVSDVQATGTEIKTPDDLKNISNDLNGSYYLANNIDMSGVTFTPIGPSSSSPFKGTFDGNGYAIQNLTISGTSDYQGLFGYLDSATVKNLTIENCNINGGNYTAAVAGYSKGSKITGVKVDGGSIAGSMYVSSIVGCAIDSASSSDPGTNTEVSNCSNSATIHATYGYVGGIVGYAKCNSSSYFNTSTAEQLQTVIENCVNTGNIQGGGTIGGILGEAAYPAAVKNCSNTGIILSSKGTVGGIVGKIEKGGSVVNCFNTAFIGSGGSDVGGVVGEAKFSITAPMSSVTISNSYNTGNAVSSGGSAGGVLGYIYISAKDFVSTITVDGCYNTGHITSVYSTGYAGGIVGLVFMGSSDLSNVVTTVTNCYNAGSVTAIDNYSKGGIFGYISVPSSSTTVTLSMKNDYYNSDVISTGYGSIANKVTIDTSALVGVSSAGMSGPNALTSMQFDTPSNWTACKAQSEVDEHGDTVSYYPQLSSFVTNASDKTQFPALTWHDFDGVVGEIDAYISTPQQFQAMQYNLGGNFILVDDIDLTTLESYSPVGATVGFLGKIDGGNHTVTVNISSSSDYQGVFTKLIGANIKNLNVSGSVSGANYVGGLAGSADRATIQNCNVTCDVQATGDYVGGISGYMSGSALLDNAGHTGFVSGQKYVGGLVGEGTTITNSHNAGSVAASGNYSGGIAGKVVATLSNCYNTAEVTSTGSYVGGIVGYVGATTGFTKPFITACYNTGKVSGVSSVGGVIGSADVNSIKAFCSSVYNTGSVTAAQNCAGGIVGWLETGIVQDCYNTGSVMANSYVGGIAGLMNSRTTSSSKSTSIQNAYNYGSVGYLPLEEDSTTQQEKLGAVIGCIIDNSYSADIVVSNCYYDTGCVAEGTPIVGEGTKYDANTVKGLTTEEMTGPDALSNMVFTSVAGTWTAYPKETLDRFYYPQLTVFFADPANPQDDEFPYAMSMHDFGDGELLPVDGYISTAEDFDKMRQNPAGNYVLHNDIDLSSITYVPVGSESARFTGKFDGCGFSLNINITGNSDYTGLFGYADQNALIENFTLTGNVQGGNYTGGVVAYAQGATIRNCYNQAQVKGNGFVGGLAGEAEDSTIQHCSNNGQVNGSASKVGGLVGCLTSTTSRSSEVSDSYNTGSVFSRGSNAGGVAGEALGTVSIRNCYNIGYIYALSSTGGIVGLYSGNTQLTMANCYYNTDTCNVSTAVNGNNVTQTNVKGLTNSQMSGSSALTNMAFTSEQGVWSAPKTQRTSANSYGDYGYYYPQLSSCVTNTNDLTQYPMLADLHNFNGVYCSVTGGYITTAAELQAINNNPAGNYVLINDIDLAAEGNDQLPDDDNNNFTTIGTSSNPFTGLFDGAGKQISNLQIADNTTASGLFGYAQYASIYDISVSGTLTDCKGYVGGITGYGSQTNIMRSYSAVKISNHSNGYAGGIAGCGATINNCYYTGEISSSGTAGGLIGSMTSQESIVSSYSTARVYNLDSAKIGGICGTTISPTSKNVYYANDYAGDATAACPDASWEDASGTVKGLSLADMSGAEALTNMGLSTSLWTAGAETTMNEHNDPTFHFPKLTKFSQAQDDLTYGLMHNYDGKYDVLTGYITGSSTMKSMDLAGNYVLANDVTINDSSTWKEIGSTETPFNGKFDGNGFTITNKNSIWYQDFFGAIGEDALVENFIYTGKQVSSEGAVTPLLKGTLHSVYSQINVSDSSNQTGHGGLVGIVDGGTIYDCVVTGSVYASDYVGGIAGMVINQGTISNSYTIGAATATATDPCVGGVVASVESGSTVNNCYYNSTRSGGAAQAIGSGSGTNVAGLDNSQMSGPSALDNMVFTSGDGVWVTPPAGATNEQGDVMCFYPQLSLFISNVSDPSADEFPTLGSYLHDFGNGDYEPVTGGYISTPEEFLAIEKGKNYVLTDNLDFEGKDYAGISLDSGKFDGGNHTISNIQYVFTSASSYAGLFTSMDVGGLVANVTVKNSSFTAKSDAGGIVGYCYGGTIRNCKVVDCTISSNDMYAGGIVGFANAGTSIIDCSSLSVFGASVRAAYGYVGGIAGYTGGSENNRNTIKNCANSADLYVTQQKTDSEGATVADSYVGGIAGYAAYADISNVLNRGNISYDTSAITKYEYTGGLVGKLSNSSISDSYNEGQVQGRCYVGGLVSNMYASTVQNCANTGDIVAVIGGACGLVCKIENASVLQNSYNIGNIFVNSTGYYTAGIAGYAAKSTISNCYTAGDINSSDAAAIIDFASYATLSNTYYNKDVLAADIPAIGSANINTGFTALTTSQMTGSGALNNMTFDNASTVWKAPEDNTINAYQDTIYNYPTLQAIPDVDSSVTLHNFEALGGPRSVTEYITNEKEFNQMSSYGNYVLISDLNFNNESMEPKLLTNSNFDGNGHSIQNINVYTEGQNVGLFSTINTVEDLTVSGQVQATAGDDANGFISRAGGIAAQATTMKNCHSSVDVVAPGAYLGGLVGSCTTIEDSTNSGNVTCSGTVNESDMSRYTIYTGGLAGRATTVTNCSNSGSVTGIAYTGGLVGFDASVSNSFNTGDVTGRMCVGGIMACNNSNKCLINSCYNTGTIKVQDGVSANNAAIGGIIGYISYGTIQDCYNLGDIDGTSTNANDSSVGGLIGMVHGATITNCYVSNNIIVSNTQSLSEVGNIIGVVSGKSGTQASISDCHYNYNKDLPVSEALNVPTDSTDFVTLTNVSGMGIEEITGPNALTNMGFSNQNQAWIAAPSGSTNEYGDLNVYYPQLSTFVTNPENPDPNEFYGYMNLHNFNNVYREVDYYITSAEELSAISQDLDANYVLTTDIDLAQADQLPDDDQNNFTPIGSTDNPFVGQFDGNGHSISNLQINSTSDNVGLFGFVSGNALISNIKLSGAVTGSANVGGIIGEIYVDSSGTAEIMYCENNADVSITGSAGHAGGIAGSVDVETDYESENTIIQGCVNNGTITLSDSRSGSASAGGIAGYCTGMEVSDNSFVCDFTSVANNGDIIVADSNVGGGLIGLCKYGSFNIQNAYNTGSVHSTGSNSSLGGFVGKVDTNNSTNIYNSYTIGEVTSSSSTSYLGILVGYYVSTNSNTLSKISYSSDFMGDATGIYGYAKSTTQLNISDVQALSTVDMAGPNALSKMNLPDSVWTAGPDTMVDSVLKDQHAFLPQLTCLFEDPSHPQNIEFPNLNLHDFNGTMAVVTDYINTPQEMEKINQNLEGNYVVTADLTLEDSYQPIGTRSSEFGGKFDGLNHQITVNISTSGYAGLFGMVDNNALIVNVVLNGSVQSTGGGATGGIAGGIAAFIYSGVIQNCVNNAQVQGAGSVGGIVGFSRYGDIQDCTNNGSITLTEAVTTSGTKAAGGIIGYAGDKFSLLNNKNYGEISSLNSSAYAGGVVGGVATTNAIDGCMNAGAVHGAAISGGIAGDLSDMSMQNCYNTGDISASSNAGGLVGSYNIGSNNVTLKNCYNLGEIESYDSSGGGLIGFVGSKSSKKISYSLTVDNCYNAAATSNAGTASGIGVLIGNVENVKFNLNNSYYSTDAMGDATETIGNIDSTATVVQNKVSGVTGEQMTGASALTNMPNLDSSTWVVKENDTTGSEDYGLTKSIYYPQIISFVADPTNPQIQEMSRDSFHDFGDGKYVDFTYINNASELQAINDGLTGNYVLTTDIDLSVQDQLPDDSNNNFTPIGSSNSFTGKFDGLGHVVQNLQITATSSNQGLFGSAGYDSRIVNLGVTGTVSGSSYVGGIAGSSSGTIANCFNQANVTGINNYVGGISGSSQLIQQCYNTGTITARGYVGGISGDGDTVSNSYNMGPVYGSEDVYAITGAFISTCTNCYYDVDRAGDATGVSRSSTAPDARLHTEQMTGVNAFDNMPGLSTSSFTVKANETTPTLDNGTTVVAYAPALTIFLDDSANPKAEEMPQTQLHNFGDGNYTGFSYVHNGTELQKINKQPSGNFVLANSIDLQTDDQLPNDSANNFTAIGSKRKPFVGKFDGMGYEVQNLQISTSTDAQGLFGYVSNGCLIENVGITGSVCGNNQVGALVGLGFIQKDQEGNPLDGSISIDNCYSQVSVTGNGDSVGGVAGCLEGGSVASTFNNGSVTGQNGVGGVVGNAAATLTNCYNTGSVSGAESVGGISGVQDAPITNAFSVGAIHASTANGVGGIVGTLSSSAANVSNCYYNIEVVGDAVSSAVGANEGASLTNVEPCYTSKMTGSNAVGTNGMQFSDASAWLTQENTDVTAYYPHLATQPQETASYTAYHTLNINRSAEDYQVQTMNGYDPNGMVAHGGNYQFSVSTQQGFAIPIVRVGDQDIQPISSENNVSVYKVENITQNYDVSIFAPEQPPTAINLTANSTMDYGTTQTLTASVQPESLLQKYKGVTWKVENGTGIATLTNQTDTSVTLMPVQAGTVTVTATSNVIPSISSSVEITINKATPQVTFPSAASVVYGETLAQASLTGANANGCQGSFEFVNSDTKLHVQSNPSSQQIQFVPQDTTNYNTVNGGSIPVTVSSKEITVQAENATKDYKAPNPDFTFSLNSDILVQGDTKESLGLTLKAVDQNGDAITQDTPAGDYQIVKDSATNRDYSINVLPGILTISKIDDPSVKMPTSATVYATQKLSEAQLEGQTGDGTFHFESDIADKIMDYGDTGSYNIIYTPNNSSYNETQSVITVNVISGISSLTIDFATPKNIDGRNSTPLVMQNSYQDFSTTVEGGFVSDDSVTWSIESAHDSGTTLTAVDGKERLTISPQQTTGKLTLKAVSNQDNNVVSTIELRVVSRGDFDGNTVLNAKDSFMLQKEIASEAQTDVYNPFYDLNTDDKVNAVDLSAFLKIMSGIQ